MSDQHDRVEEILSRTLELEPNDRLAFLAEACGDDHELRDKVESVLRAADEAQGFMEGKTAVQEVPVTEGPGSQIGRYKLLQKIGEGGFGVVYMAEQQEPVVRKVALKVIKLGMDTRQVVARFEAERQALALMDHPHIAKVLDGGATDAGRPFFVMELVQGIPITRFCDESRFSTAQRLELFGQVCSAIQHAHQKGIIHRDIKPSNILVTLHGDKPVPKVIDFGIAKATQQRLTEKTLFTQFQQFIGTPAYMSPEQASLSGLDIDTRSDIYSLGVLLYELLTGKTPFDTKSLLSAGYEEIRRVIREVDPPRPSTRLSTLAGEELASMARQHDTDPKKLGVLMRGDLDLIVMKALEKDRTRRYETANGLAMDLQRYLNNEPVSAVAPSAGYKLRKFVRRNRKTVGISIIIAALLVAWIATSAWSGILASRAAVAKANETRAKANETEALRMLEQQLSETQLTLERMQTQKAEELLSTDAWLNGLGYLGQVLRSNPSNQVAAARLTSALIYRRFSIPVAEPMRHEYPVGSAQLSPDGQRVVTASYDRTARVWDANTGAPLTAPMRHEDIVLYAQLSPEGQRVVTASQDKTARVWDANTGEPLIEPMRHEATVASAQFSPDGQRVVTASQDKTARVWDANTGEPLTEPMRHEGPVSSAQFSPDGQRVVTASQDGTARVWNVNTGAPLTEPIRHEGPVSSAQFSPEGQRVVTASGDKTARVWDANTGEPLTEPIRHEDYVISAQFSPDGQRVLTASRDKTARVWDVNTGAPLTEPMRHEGWVNSAQFSPDGQRVVTASGDKTARVWDANTGAPLTEPMRHEDEVMSAQFTPEGQRVVTASYDKTVLVWDANTGAPLTEPMRHEATVVSAQFSPDGQRVVTASQDKTARVWDANTGEPLTAPMRHDGPVSAQFSPDGQRVVTASWDKTARVWDANTGEPLAEPMRHEGRVNSAQFSPDGQRVVTASSDGAVLVWDANTGAPLTEPLRHEPTVWSAQFSPDGQWMVTVSLGMARVWDANTGEPLTEPMVHDRRVNSAQFSPDGQRMVTASGGTARVWDANTGAPLTEPMRHENSVFSAQFSPDGQRVVTASEDKTARVWDANIGAPLTDLLRHEDTVWSAQFSPDGQRVVTASWDKTARVWDANTGEPLTEPIRHEDYVISAQFSPDGQRVLTASRDKTARVWDVNTGAPPVPSWFLDWAESRVGRQLSASGQGDPIPLTEQRRHRDLVSARTDADFYTRIAQWIQADPSTRTISPHAALTVPEYVARRIRENTLESLREAVRVAPTNPTAFSRLALLLANQDPQQHPGHLEGAEFYARYALKLSPDATEARRVLADIHSRKHQTPPEAE